LAFLAALSGDARAQAPPDPLGEREVLYWYDPMYPGTRFDAPGKSPFMDMDLIPRYRDEGAGDAVVIDPTMVQNLGVKSVPARRGKLSFSREIPANVEFNGQLTARAQPRAEGFVSEAGFFAVGDSVKEGDLLALVTVPDWAADQSEYLLLRKQKASAAIVAGVREKLRLAGMPEEMLLEVDRTGAIQTTLKILSPLSGVITELDVYPGMNVDKGQTLAVIQGTDPIWVTAFLPEKEAFLSAGRPRLTLSAFPGRAFEVLKLASLPIADENSRALLLRLHVANPEGLLKPGLTATLSLRAQGPEGLIIPTQSLIDLGEEQRVVTVQADGSFLPKLVTVGLSAREETLISSGLSEGEEVVTVGLFLIDSEANLRGALERMRGGPLDPPGTLPEGASPAP
jgi:Cu(I)/Ag(I) efflux system membrane fusion protein